MLLKGWFTLKLIFDTF